MLQKNVILAPYSNYKIGGPASYFLEFNDIDELRTGFKEWQKVAGKEGLDPDKIFLLGGGTNILFSDEGYQGLILKNNISFIKNLGSNSLEIGSATTWKELNNYCIDHSLSGTEWSGGLPGSIGGSIFGNAGAFGGETKDSILSVKSIEIASGKITERTNKECLFDYRQSIFKGKLQGREIILSAIMQFSKGSKEEIQKAIEEKINYREAKQPLDYPSAGSTFKNVDLKICSPELIESCKSKIKNDPFPVIPVAVLISRARLIGRRVGDAMVSDKHPNFLINLGNAKSSDVKSLIKIVQDEVLKSFKVQIEPEVIILEK